MSARWLSKVCQPRFACTERRYACENCGEYYLSQDIANRLDQQAEESLQHGAEVEIGRFVMSAA